MNNINIIDRENWRLEFPKSIIGPLGFSSVEGDVFEFNSALALLVYLSTDKNDDYIRFQGKIQQSLKDNIHASIWKEASPPLKFTPNFKKYRKNDYDKFHAAADARASNRATSSQINCLDGLEGEIRSSNLVVPRGQKLFHGRANSDLISLKPYPRFLSTSLDPIVARQSAMRRAGNGRENGRPTVYILTLREDIRALWGQRGKSYEWEILLPTDLTVCKTSENNDGDFAIVEADIFGQS